MELLLVEDNPGDVRLTKEALDASDLEFSLTVARDGIEGLEALYKRADDPKGRLFDLILLDLNMPRMPGLDMLAKVRADENLRAVPVLVLTTSHAPKDVKQAYAVGANGYVVKPIDLDEFRDIVGAIGHFWGQVMVLPGDT